MIEEVVIQTVETPTLVIVERAVGIGVLGRYAWMVFTFLIRVFNEQHLVNHTLQSIA